MADVNDDKGFKLRANHEGKATLVILNKKESIWINRGKKAIPKSKLFPEGLEVTKSADLKKVYDSNPVWQKVIQAPKNYKAPWEAKATK